MYEFLKIKKSIDSVKEYLVLLLYYKIDLVININEVDGFLFDFIYFDNCLKYISDWLCIDLFIYIIWNIICFGERRIK